MRLVVKKVEQVKWVLLMEHRCMRKFLSMFFAVIGLQDALAHTIGGTYASQVNCRWGQFGNQKGYIGTYNVNGQWISQFFGNNYCPY